MFVAAYGTTFHGISSIKRSYATLAFVLIPSQRETQ